MMPSWQCRGTAWQATAVAVQPHVLLLVRLLLLLLLLLLAWLCLIRQIICAVNRFICRSATLHHKSGQRLLPLSSCFDLLRSSLSCLPAKFSSDVVSNPKGVTTS
jgi:hypothetical protein